MFGGNKKETPAEAQLREENERLQAALKEHTEELERLKREKEDELERLKREKEDELERLKREKEEESTRSEAERMRAEEAEKTLEAFRTQYDLDATAWNERFQELEQEARKASEMEEEFNALKASVQAFEAAERDQETEKERLIATFEKKLADLEQELELAKASAEKNEHVETTEEMIDNLLEAAPSQDGIFDCQDIDEVLYEAEQKEQDQDQQQDIHQQVEADKEEKEYDIEGEEEEKELMQEDTVIVPHMPDEHEEKQVQEEAETGEQVVTSPAVKDDKKGTPKRGQAQVDALRFELRKKEEKIEQLESLLAEKMKELVDQGEKNYKLYEKLQDLKNAETGARAELKDMRTLVVQEITGKDADLGAYDNISNEELMRILNQCVVFKHQNPNRAVSILNEAKSLRKAQERDADDPSSPFDATSSCTEGPNKSQLVSRNEAIRLEAEVKVQKQTIKRLQGKIEELNEIERGGIAAMENMNTLKRRAEDLASRLRREKDMRKKTEDELNNANERIKELSQHIEKLMVHMKHEAAAKKAATADLKNYRKEATLLRQRNAVLTKKNKTKERILEELREGSRILEDQLRLMDQKYVQLRTKLDWTRTTSNREVKRIQNEANRIRASFALAFSQSSAGHDGSALFNLKGLLAEGKYDDEEVSDEEEDEEDEEEDEGDSKHNNPGERQREAPSTSVSQHAKVKGNPQHKQPSFLSKPLEHAAGQEILPSIESIIPQGSERYKPRE